MKTSDASPSSGRLLGPNGDSETLRPAEVDPLIVHPRRRSGGKVLAPLVIAAALIVTSVSWIRLSADAGKSSTPEAQAPTRPAAEAVVTRPAEKPTDPVAQAPPPPSPAPVHAEPAPEATTAAANPSASSPALASAFGAALNRTATSVLVSVRTVPPAIIFEAGKRIGSGTIEVNVEPTNKKRLTALLDGHAPQNFTLDGSRPSVTIMMKPVGKNTASFPPVGGAKPAAEATTAKAASSPPTAEFGDPINDVVQ